MCVCEGGGMGRSVKVNKNKHYSNYHNLKYNSSEYKGQSIPTHLIVEVSMDGHLGLCLPPAGQM